MRRILLWTLLWAMLVLGGCDSSNLVELPTGQQTGPEVMVHHWSSVAVDTSGRDHTALGAHEQLGPTRSSRAMAMVHVAMHDAIQAIQGRYETYLPQPPAPPDASIQAAVAVAAHDVLVALYPNQLPGIEEELAADLARVPDGPSKVAGMEVGRRAAEAILAERENDGSEAAVQTGDYLYGLLPGEWREDPLNPFLPLGPQWGLVRPFVIDRADQFRCPPPPPLTSPEYAEAFDEARRLGGDGIVTPTERTEEQTIIGIFWAYDGTPSLCAPPRLYNQITLAVADQHGMRETGELARLLALANLAMADACIASWEAKFFYNFWRPVTAIREADAGTGPSGLGDGNPLTEGDPTWTPLGAPASNLAGNNFTPPFPTYPSGHATFGGALFQVLRQVYGRDDMPFQFVSDEFNGVTTDAEGNVRPLVVRHFATFSEAEEENGQSRIYLGIHFDFDKTEGIWMGNEIGNSVVERVLRPR